MLKKKNFLVKIFSIILTIFMVEMVTGSGIQEVDAKGTSIGINWLKAKNEYSTNQLATINVKKQANKVILVSTEIGGVGREAVDLSFQEKHQ